MARIQSLAILTQDGEGRDFLAERYGVVIDGVMQRLVSLSMKNQDLSGDPTSGSVEAKRFVNAEVKAYGTARAAGKGDKVKAKPVPVQLNEDIEIVEELEDKDTRLYGVDGLVTRRTNNHILRIASKLDKAFFAAAYAEATEVEIPASAAIEDELEAVIQECENTQNDFVDGVPREFMHLVLNTNYYGKVRNNLDKQTRANVDTDDEEFYAWHGVECNSSVHLPTGCRYLLIVDGAVAQPSYTNQYTAEKIQMSEAYALELFGHYGTKVVAADLIFTGIATGLSGLSVDANVTADLFGKTAGDLQSGVSIDADKISGVLHYITDYSSAGYTGDEKSGNFLVVHAACDGADSITCELVGGIHGVQTLDPDGIAIFRITDINKQAVRFTAIKGTETRVRTFDLNHLILETA